MVEIPLHTIDGDEAAFLLADKLEGDDDERLATKSMNARTVSVDYRYRFVYTVGIE